MARHSPGDRPPARAPRLRVRVPAPRALPAPERLAQRGVRRRPRARPRAPRSVRDRPPCGRPPARALGGRAPAGGAGAGHGRPAAGAAARRAVRGARPAHARPRGAGARLVLGRARRPRGGRDPRLRGGGPPRGRGGHPRVRPDRAARHAEPPGGRARFELRGRFHGSGRAHRHRLSGRSHACGARRRRAPHERRPRQRPRGGQRPSLGDRPRARRAGGVRAQPIARGGGGGDDDREPDPGRTRGSPADGGGDHHAVGGAAGIGDRHPRVRGLAGGRHPPVGNLAARVRRLIEFDLTDEQKLIRETARDFTDREIVPVARENDRNERFDLDMVRKLGEMGYLGPIVDEEYGGRGLDYRTYGLIVEEIGRGDSSARTVVSVQTSLVCSSLQRWGTEAQKHHWLPKLCAGEILGCFGLTEPGTGSDAANLSTRAEKVDGGWRISGQKQWISMGNYAKVALVFAQTDPEQKHRGLAAFLVPTDSDGFSTSEIHGKLGLRAADTAELSLDGVEVGDDAVLGDVGDGFKVAMSALDSGRFSVAAGCVGICQGCVNASVEYAKQRQQFGRPIASFQLVQQMIADMIVDTEAARSLVWRAAWLKDTDQPNTTETSIAKLFATEAAVRCANNAIQVHGGSGYVDDHPVERYLRDARVTTLYEGTSQIQKLIIARSATGVNAMVWPWPWRTSFSPGATA